MAGSKTGNSGSYLKNLDYSVVQQCMHCGLCLPTCPTYDATKMERNSPRGRIALMRAVADGRLEATKSFADEMYFCLGCLACMSACPAGVNYAELFENARAEAEASGNLGTPKRTFVRWLTLNWLFGDLRRLQLLGIIIRLYQGLGLQKLVRNCGILKLLPLRMRQLEAMTPLIQPAFSAEMIAPITAASGAKRYKVAMLTGCAQDLMFSDVNRDTVEVLAANGCEIHTPPEQNCCGSLHAHNGELELARALARQSIDLFPPANFDAIITNAAGCGSHLKHYSVLLKDDPNYAASARIWDAKIKDIHEWLDFIGLTPPPKSKVTCKQKVTYHEACHLCHGQKISNEPRRLLKAVGNVELIELAESTWCCGSAGIYNVIQPEMANQLLARKLTHIRATGAETVATGNPGCMAHIQSGMNQAGDKIKVVHPISLLAEAYRQ
ncbi:MAG: hypothetical protein JWN25_2166 [Verrucomicrobiales bacterium]|nr:hypothetical protein [Verrucomicrobiales bacterium]